MTFCPNGTATEYTVQRDSDGTPVKFNSTLFDIVDSTIPDLSPTIKIMMMMRFPINLFSH